MRRWEAVPEDILAAACTPEEVQIIMRAEVSSAKLVSAMHRAGEVVPMGNQQKVLGFSRHIEVDSQQVPHERFSQRMSKSLIKVNNGEIWTNSEAGAGNTVAFALPCTNAGLSGKSLPKST